MPRVFKEETEVVPLLTKMHLPRWVILEIAGQVAGERANVSSYDAPPVIGFETWRWGTRFSREHAELGQLGWEVCEEDQVSGIKNDALGLKLVFCNTDSNTANPKRSPKNANEKGPASCRLIGRNSGQKSLFPVEPEKANELWYLCCHFSDESICIEVSRPSNEVGGIITAFSDRIIVAKPGEIPGTRRTIVPQDFAEVPKPKVIRKGD